MDTTTLITNAAEKMVADAAQLDAASRQKLVSKLAGYTKLGGVRLMLPTPSGKVQVPADVVLDTIARIEALD